MGKILVEKISYTEVTKNISQAEYNRTQEEYLLSRSPEKYIRASKNTLCLHIIFSKRTEKIFS